MSAITIQQVMSSRFRTSAAADSQTKYLMEALGLSTKANVARLAIGRSLGLGGFSIEPSDAKGLEVPASSMFTQDDVAVWLGLLVTHARLYGGQPVETMEALRAAIRSHWHRGAELLLDEWRQCNENYDQFVTTLARRRADLPDVGAKASQGGGGREAVIATEAAVDRSTELQRALADIGVLAEVKGVEHGPRLSRYKVALKDVNQFDKLKRGVERLAFVLGLNGQLPSISSSNEAKTLLADVPRPRGSWKTAAFEDFLAAVSSQPKDGLFVCPGVDVVGRPVAFDLRTAPHLLVGGSTGQGKSVCVHAILTSLVVRHKPSEIKLALMDPKRVEFAVYARSKFLWNDSIAIGDQESRAMLDDLIEEMDQRYRAFERLGVSNLREAKEAGSVFPYIVACIDELAELILTDRSLETKIARLAQMARAAGIHLILATQRPDAKTFSGLIRSNVPARIALTVQKASESQIILDDTGAEALLGSGDMIIKMPSSEAIRAHGYFLSLSDVASILGRAE
jgi:DNA segregation ATPase FtsK/SpoIIIE, S-DNA-T family